MSNLKVTLEGRGMLALTDNDHIATGGEGSVYKKAGTVIKIYTDPAKMKRDEMGEKIKLLSQLAHPYIGAPVNLVLDERSREIGYYMPFVEGEPLPRLFTNDFRQREGITDKDSSILVDCMHQVVRFAHDHQAIMVDANELNWVVELGGKKGPVPHVIDVDSWAIGKWPAKVIMPSIRDLHTKGFTDASDWYSWGIVTFQVYTGIHPYKGTLDGYKPYELEQRMKANASVFTHGVRLNRVVRDFSCIPTKLLEWYRAAFQQGDRSMPPSPFEITVAAPKAAVVARVTVTTTGRLAFDKIFGKPNDPVTRIFPCGAVLLQSGLFIDLNSKRDLGRTASRECEIIKVDGGWLKAVKAGTDLSYSYIDSATFKEVPLALSLTGQHLVRYENRLFLVTQQGLMELKLKILGRPILSAGHTWGVMVNSTRWYDGVGVQDAMGAMFLIAPFDANACGQVRVRELDGLTPVMAKAGHRFVAVTAVDRSGTYHKLEFAFDAEYKSYKIWRTTAASPELNMAILPKGVCATIVEDNELVIFVPSNSSVNKISDKSITTEMLLSNWENTVVYILDGNVWKVSMK